MGRILITGACGYIGAHLADILADNGYKVTAFDCSPPGNNPDWINKMEDIIIGDIRSSDILSNLCDRNFDVIIHLISLNHIQSQGNPKEVLDINVLPIWNLLNAFHKKKLNLFLYLSTQQVIGDFPLEFINENISLHPMNHYGLTHAIGEQLTSYYNRISKISCINIRLSNGYGAPIFNENNCWWLVVNQLCKSAYENERIFLSSDGSPLRDFIHVRDIGTAIKALIKQDKISERTFNIGSGQTLTILELSEIVRSIFRERYNKIVPVFLPNNVEIQDFNIYVDIKRFRIDTTRISQMGYYPEYSLEKGINQIFDFLEHNN